MSGTWTEGVPAPLEFTRQPGLGSPARTFEPTPVPAPAISPVALTGLYFPTGADNTRHAALKGFPFMSGAPKLFFRTLAPAHGGFSQQIDSGRLTESEFDYKTLLPR